MSPASEKLLLENHIAIMVSLTLSRPAASEYERELLRVQIARSMERVREIERHACNLICDDCDFSTGHRCARHR